MGYYINPRNGSKEDFLTKYAKESSYSDCEYAVTHLSEGEVPIVWINNGQFTAAGIAYSVEELEAFTAPRDWRPKKLFLIPIDVLDGRAGLPVYFPEDLRNGKFSNRGSNRNYQSAK